MQKYSIKYVKAKYFERKKQKNSIKIAFIFETKMFQRLLPQLIETELKRCDLKHVIGTHREKKVENFKLFFIEKKEEKINKKSFKNLHIRQKVKNS